MWLRLATLEQLLDSAITTCPATLLGSPAAKDALGMVLMLATAAIPMTNRAPVRSVSMFATHLCLWGEAATANGRAGARRRLRRGTSGVVDLTPFKAVIDAALAVQGAAVVSACVASLVAPRDAHTTAAANARTAQTAVTATRGAIVRVLHAVMAYTMDQVGRCPMYCACVLSPTHHSPPPWYATLTHTHTHCHCVVPAPGQGVVWHCTATPRCRSSRTVLRHLPRSHRHGRRSGAGVFHRCRPRWHRRTVAPVCVWLCVCGCVCLAMCVAVCVCVCVCVWLSWATASAACLCSLVTCPCLCVPCVVVVVAGWDCAVGLHEATRLSSG